MPAVSRKQQKAAQLELLRRKTEGKRKQKKASRSFGSASLDVLRDFIKLQ